ncbi:hypothetical protein BpHYR1_022704 [Brachionus plicatilis]|uniref:Uncharacterized protein n=1 Tax=Brachionus plicatilis TaxID=10195 RepID=A0A3M7T7D1_BRAPC|nr:hypothetical protein BpHYR1_022704 [Brachionus plicatilis]
MIRLFYTLFFLLNIGLSCSKVFSFTIENTEEKSDGDSESLNSPESILETERANQEQLNRIFELLEMIKNHPPNKSFNHFDYKNLDRNSLDQDLNENHLSRDRRRLSVFKNIYQRCRIQKRKEKTLCLYLANLYQNLKGFHGL